VGDGYPEVAPSAPHPVMHLPSPCGDFPIPTQNVIEPRIYILTQASIRKKLSLLSFDRLIERIKELNERFKKIKIEATIFGDE
jgi:hypothetical protein